MSRARSYENNGKRNNDLCVQFILRVCGNQAQCPFHFLLVLLLLLLLCKKVITDLFFRYTNYNFTPVFLPIMYVNEVSFVV